LEPVPAPSPAPEPAPAPAPDAAPAPEASPPAPSSLAARARWASSFRSATTAIAVNAAAAAPLTSGSAAQARGVAALVSSSNAHLYHWLRHEGLVTRACRPTACCPKQFAEDELPAFVRSSASVLGALVELGVLLPPTAPRADPVAEFIATRPAAYAALRKAGALTRSGERSAKCPIAVGPSFARPESSDDEVATMVALGLVALAPAMET
jgi:hypothetical protein